MGAEQKRDLNVHINVKKDNGYKMYRYTIKTDKSYSTGASYAQNDYIVEDILRSLKETPADSKVTLSSAHRIMADTHKYETFLTDEELKSLANRIRESRKDLKIVLKPVGLVYIKDIDSPIGV